MLHSCQNPTTSVDRLRHWEVNQDAGDMYVESLVSYLKQQQSSLPVKNFFWKSVRAVLKDINDEGRAPISRRQAAEAMVTNCHDIS